MARYSIAALAGTKRGYAGLALSLVVTFAVSGCVKPAPTGGGNAEGQGCRLAFPPPASVAPALPDVPVPGPAAQAPVDGSALRIGLAFDVGGRGDVSFNDAAGAGVDRAVARLGAHRDQVAERTAAQGESEDAKLERLRQLAATGYSPIIAVGYAYADTVATVAAQFPATKFAVIDSEVVAPNVTPLLFAEEQGSFLVGVAAAYKSKNCHIGFVGGVDTPLIQKFEAGYLQGAKMAAPNIAVDVKYLSPAGDISGFLDPAKANVVGKGELDNGADVLFAAAGSSGKGTFEAVAAAGKMAIGVDSDQYNQTNLGDIRKRIITSMIKKVDVAVFDYLRAVALGTEASLPKVFSLADDGVGYSTSGGQLGDIVDRLDAYKAQIVAGHIVVSSTP